ncbi:MAG: hypothetical protein WB797_16925 [Nocardioides sp.]
MTDPRPASGVPAARPRSGLTVRWSLADAPEGVEEALAAYIADTSYDRFSALPGLAFKTWQMVPGEWFEGCYVFADDATRADFQEEFSAGAADAPGSVIIGSPPVLIEACAVVAIAEGPAGFHPTRS